MSKSKIQMPKNIRHLLYPLFKVVKMSQFPKQTKNEHIFYLEMNIFEKLSTYLL